MAAFLLLQTQQVELRAKSWTLVSSDHNTFTQFSSESLANFRRACTAGRSALVIVLLVAMIPAASRSFTRSSRVVLGWFLTVLMIFETPRGEILHGAPVRGRLTVILCFFHLWIITPTVVTFSPSCLAMVLQPIPALCRSTILSLTFLNREFGIWLIDCFCRQVVFYNGNKLRLGALPVRDLSSLPV